MVPNGYCVTPYKKSIKSIKGYFFNERKWNQEYRLQKQFER